MVTPQRTIQLGQTDQWYRIEIPDPDQHLYWKWYITEVALQNSGASLDSLIVVLKQMIIHVEKMKLDLCFTYTQQSIPDVLEA